MSSILQICQDVASLVATQKPTDLFDADNQQSAIFLSIAKDTLDSLRRYGDWQELTKEGVLHVRPHKQVYFFNAFCPDFYALLPNTLYIRDTAEKIIGSVTPEQWMRDRFFNGGSDDLQFTIRNNCLRFLKKPKRHCHIVFYYRSAVIALNMEECDYVEKTELTSNEDVPVFDEYLVKLGIMWRWYKRNGLPYEEEFNEYEREVKSKFAGSFCAGDIHLGRCFNNGIEGGVHVVSYTKPRQ